jgi:hypothetical protein
MIMFQVDRRLPTQPLEIGVERRRRLDARGKPLAQQLGLEAVAFVGGPLRFNMYRIYIA